MVYKKQFPQSVQYQMKQEADDVTEIFGCTFERSLRDSIQVYCGQKEEKKKNTKLRNGTKISILQKISIY